MEIPPPPADQIKLRYASVILHTADGKIIAQQRDNTPGIDNPGKIATFGGRIEPGEDAKYAAWRELVQEETNLQRKVDDLQFFSEDVAWRSLTSEWIARYFYAVEITDAELAKLEVYEGSGWAEVTDINDPRIVETWQPVLTQAISTFAPARR